MRDVEPDFWRNLREELVAGRQWVDRSVVLGYAALTGLVVVGFTLLSESASHGFEQLRGRHAWAPWLMLAWTPALTVALLAGQAELPGVYTLLKFCATWLAAWTGVPAGVFAPSLAMVCFLATTQGSITAFIIVMEMVSGHAMVLSLMACSLLASGVARLITRPMYLELAALLLPVAAPPAATAASNGRSS